MSINIVGAECCGCRTCKIVCKFNAISVVTDIYGFEQVSVDTNRCHECGVCEQVCPVLNIEIGFERYFCGAAYALDKGVKKQGSSGGLFGVFARRIIQDGGYVYGAAFDDNLKLKTTKASTMEELIPLYKSKYLLCDTNDKFIEIKAKLDEGQKILYCSSPCQVAALKLFLKSIYDNLLTVDFVCHGVGSQVLFDKSIEFSEKQMDTKIRKVVFRYKIKQASSHYYYFYCKDKNRCFEKKDLYLSFPYYNAYCKQLICREGCYTCKYATTGRVADITIGDFHNIEKYDSSIDRFAGVSMFVCNTVKGKKFFDIVKEELFIRTFEWDILRRNNRFDQEAEENKQRREFMDMVATQPFEVAVKKYLRPMKDWKRLLYYKSPMIVRSIVRKFAR